MSTTFTGFVEGLRASGLSEVASFVAGLITALLGVWYRDRMEASRKRNESVRALISPAATLGRTLRQALNMYEHTANNDPQRVPDLFRASEELVPGDKLAVFSAAVDKSTSLPMECLQAWSAALDSIAAAQRQHASLRSLIGRSGARPRIVDRRHEYAHQLRQATDDLAVAAEATLRFAPNDARSPLRELIKKG